MQTLRYYFEAFKLYLKLFFTPGKGTPVKMNTNKYSDVFVRKGDIGQICLKKLQHGKVVINVDLGVRFIVCQYKDVLRISKKEYIEWDKAQHRIDLTDKVGEYE